MEGEDVLDPLSYPCGDQFRGAEIDNDQRKTRKMRETVRR
jgi:hypothetical protein